MTFHIKPMTQTIVIYVGLALVSITVLVSLFGDATVAGWLSEWFDWGRGVEPPPRWWEKQR